MIKTESRSLDSRDLIGQKCLSKSMFYPIRLEIPIIAAIYELLSAAQVLFYSHSR